ncbi:IPT/TIG domain-containing protein [Actinoplanes aureus]|uniref:IPT/TIG domain-containing protein n=1 Tax=Actinoplanes aureus TaxID=2792083 RepID=A0A931C5E0_9ACTN|nr:IPT/TIG domain-containing protein [Actinoplanes aureus]MBG0562549.1 IPT/TIG domain-containing protein [Actinoplanes aureus]
MPSTAYQAENFNTSGLVLAGTQTQAKWAVCAYDSDSTTTSTLLATALYTLTLKPTITSISPKSSPAAGGQLITVTGTGFAPVTTPITATAGGIPLTNIKVAANGNSFTATTGARAADSSLPLIVTAPGGTVSSLDPDNNGLPQDGDPATADAPIAFSYSNGITITPNTGAVGTMVTIDVTGAGFSPLDFEPTGGDPTSALAHVFLVEGAYNSATNRGVAECVVGMVVSDTQLVCDLDLAASKLNPTTSGSQGVPIAEDAYILTVVQDGSLGAVGANPSIISSGAAFVVGPY